MTNAEGEMPATFVTWHAAAAHCASIGKRLPTEAEWEFAAGAGAAAHVGFRCARSA